MAPQDASDDYRARIRHGAEGVVGRGWGGALRVNVCNISTERRSRSSDSRNSQLQLPLGHCQFFKALAITRVYPRMSRD